MINKKLALIVIVGVILVAFFLTFLMPQILSLIFGKPITCHLLSGGGRGWVAANCSSPDLPAETNTLASVINAVITIFLAIVLAALIIKEKLKARKQPKNPN